MKREKRYLVLKLSDVKKYLDFSDQAVLSSLVCHIDDRRNADGRPDLQCAVVEADWPEYEPTWSAIEARVDADMVKVDNKHYCNDGYWWELVRAGEHDIVVKIGRNNRVLEYESFLHETAAYNQKNKWLTEHKMFCP